MACWKTLPKVSQKAPTTAFRPSTSREPHRVGFLDLPRELRDQIYDCCLVSPPLLEIRISTLANLDSHVQSLTERQSSDAVQSRRDGETQEVQSIFKALRATCHQLNTETAERFFKNRFSAPLHYGERRGEFHCYVLNQAKRIRLYYIPYSAELCRELSINIHQGGASGRWKCEFTGLSTVGIKDDLYRRVSARLDAILSYKPSDEGLELGDLRRLHGVLRDAAHKSMRGAKLNRAYRR